MYVTWIRTSNLPDCFLWGGGVLLVSQSSDTTLQKGTDMV